MKIDKEYPATHSMSTAWYCVDEDGNVGIVDIHDYGPIPNGTENDLEVNEIFWQVFSSKSNDGIKDLNLTEEQIVPLLMPIDSPDEWEEHVFENEKYFYNHSWSEVIIKIDMTKLPILIQAYSIEEHVDDIVCISRKEGLFFVSFSHNKRGVELLEQNDVVLAKYKAPRYDGVYIDDEETEIIVKEEENHRLPIFIYNEEWMPDEGPAKRMSKPDKPMKINQLPEKLRGNVKTLKIKFNETECLQLAEHIPVYVDSVCVSNAEDERWMQISSSKNERVYYGEETGRILTNEELDKLGKKWIEGKIKKLKD